MALQFLRSRFSVTSCIRVASCAHQPGSQQARCWRPFMAARLPASRMPGCPERCLLRRYSFRTVPTPPSSHGMRGGYEVSARASLSHYFLSHDDKISRTKPLYATLSTERCEQEPSVQEAVRRTESMPNMAVERFHAAGVSAPASPICTPFRRRARGARSCVFSARQRQTGPCA